MTWRVTQEQADAARQAVRDAAWAAQGDVAADDAAAIRRACGGGGRLDDLLAESGADERRRAPGAFARAESALATATAEVAAVADGIRQRRMAGYAVDSARRWAQWIAPSHAAVVAGLVDRIESVGGADAAAVAELDRLINDRSICAVPVVGSDGPGWSGRSTEDGEGW